MKTPEERKMEKLLALLEVADKDYVTSEELAEYMEILMNVIKQMRPTYDAERDAFIQRCEAKVKELYQVSQKEWEAIQKKVSLLRDGKDGRDGETPQAGIHYPTRDQFKEMLNELAKTIKVRDGKDGKDGKDADVEPFLKKLKELERIVQANANALPATTTFVNGRRAKNLNFPNATVSYKDDTATVEVEGGSGVDEFSELTDVDVTSSAPNNNAIAQYQTSTTKWTTGISITVADTAPSDPKYGDLWIDTTP
jgi:hypothetical protein